MNKFWILIKLFIGSFFYGITSNIRGRGQKIITVAAILMLLISIAVPVTLMVSALYTPLVLMGQRELILGTLFNGASMVIFILGIPGVMGVFYFSQDIEWLLPLPIKASQIVMGKFVSILIYQYIVLSAVIPGILVYGALSGAGAVYYLSSVIVFLTLPVMPLAYGAVLSFILMRFAGFSRHKDAVKIIAAFIGISLGLWINIFFQRISTNFHTDNPEAIQNFLGQGSIFDKVSSIFFNTRFSTYCLTESGTVRGFTNLALLIFVVAAITALVYKLSEALYMKGVVGITESPSGKGALTEKQKVVLIKENSQLASWVKREIRILIRTPSYVINCISTLILPAIILIIPFAGAGEEGFAKIREFIEVSKGSSHIFLSVYIGVMSLMVSSNSIAATAVSREGKEVAILKYIPVLARTRLLAKAWGAVVLSNVTNVLLAAVMVTAGMNAETVIKAFVFGELIIVLTSISGVIIDVYSPKLDWDSEQQAVKNNMNILKTMGLMISLSAIPILVYIFETNVIAEIFGFVSALLIFMMFIIIGYRILVKNTASRFEKIE